MTIFFSFPLSPCSSWHRDGLDPVARHSVGHSTLRFLFACAHRSRWLRSTGRRLTALARVQSHPVRGEQPLHLGKLLQPRASCCVLRRCCHGRSARAGVVRGAGTRSTGTAEVEVVVRGKDVRLPDGLRRRMEAELRWGTAELDVQATLFRDDVKRQAPVLLRCKAVGPQVPLQPLECKAFTDFVV